MKLIYYSSEKGNVGDELNRWLWDRIFPGQFSTDNDTAFLGIGSILLQDSAFIEEASKYKDKIIFGTGVRSISERIILDDSWRISFLRGPFSSLRLTNTLDHFITDSAYFVALTQEYKELLNVPKKHKVSVIPYFQSMDKMDWKKICDRFGWNLISTETKDVDFFIREIAASEMIISEAMHGAILADVLRIPWKRLKFYAHLYESEKVSEFKWNDWLASVDIYDASTIDFGKSKIKRGNVLTGFWHKNKYQNRMIDLLKQSESKPFSLSPSVRFDTILEQLAAKKDELVSFLKDRGK